VLGKSVTGALGGGRVAIATGMLTAGVAEKLAIDTTFYATGLDPQAFSRYSTNPGATSIEYGISIATAGLYNGGAHMMTSGLARSLAGSNNKISRAVYYALRRSGATGRMYPKGLAPSGGVCFTAGHEILLDEPIEAVVAKSEFVGASATWDKNWLTAGVGLAIVAGAGMVVQQRRRKRNRREESLDLLFAEEEYLPMAEEESHIEKELCGSCVDPETEAAVAEAVWAEDFGPGQFAPATATAVARRGPATAVDLRPGRPTRDSRRRDETPTRSTRPASRARRWLAILPLLLAAAFCLWKASPDAPPPQHEAAAPAESFQGVRLTKPIEQIEPGDYVLSRDPETGEVSRKRVLEAFSRTTDHLRILEIRSAAGEVQTVRTTDEHPFWVTGQGFMAARELTVGDRIDQSDGAAATVVSTEYEPHPEGHPVYNFTVEGNHTYFVSAPGSRAPPLFVHNATCNPAGLRRQQFIPADEVFGAPKRTVGRPSPRQSEFDVNGLNPNHRPQVSFSNGREVPYGSRGSVRPDHFRVGEALEVKNYDVLQPSNRANLYNTIHRQYLQRISNLPKGTHQRIVIDIRGQNVPESILMRVRSNIQTITRTPDVTVGFLR